NTENPWLFHEANDAEIEEAVRLAKEAFLTYRSMPGKKKALFLRAIADEMEALGDDLIQVYMTESGLPEGRAKGERGRTMGQLRMFADLVEKGDWVEASIDTALPDRTPVPKADIRKMLHPLGPIVVFGSSNFPFAYSTAGGDTASALASGCPVIVKSHPMHAGTGELVATAILKAAKDTGMPNGVFSNLNSNSYHVGKALVQHPGVKGVGFTGSIAGGTALFKMAAEREEPIPVFAEMGSINPVVALPSSLEKKGDYWAEQYADSISLGVGQFCTCPGLILGIKSASLDAFAEALGNALVQKEPGVMLHPNIYQNFKTGKESLSAQTGTSIVVEITEDVPPNVAQQQLLTVDGDTFLANPTLHQEVFGPFAIIVKADDDAELKTIIEALEGQLTGTILGEESELKEQSAVVGALKDRVGRLIFNGVPTGVEVCPSMVHGGPFPASTDSRFTAVGIHAIKRWVRPVSYQSWPDQELPDALKNSNPLDISRLINGENTSKPV
ncbi:MAG: aldehyde dehydrogenase (NADP(+)), partial [Eudoraea sp.]|nr:aldehyde dehydrogenase (NADP(+)) [Eudoraea sp.]